MLDQVSRLTTVHAHAADGDLGPIQDALFDERQWVIRHLVVDAHDWLLEREVLISPYSIQQPVSRDGRIDVALTRRLVRASPDVDTHRPISREQERAQMRHYHYPPYWEGGGRWARGAKPYPAVFMPQDGNSGRRGIDPGATYPLRSAEQVFDFEVFAGAVLIGRVQDLVFDNVNWRIRYVVVNTQDGWRGVRQLRVGLPRVAHIDWDKQRLHVTLSRAQRLASGAPQPWAPAPGVVAPRPL